MAGKNYGTMFMGYYFDESKTNIGYTVYVEGGICFTNVAYHSKGQLKKQLIADGYKKDSIKEQRYDYK